jgi:CheY-like chemotaxis protein/HPt (histidine-containing phosphotransfer) domain-containing protein
MTVREQLLEIPQLNIASRLMRMGDSELNEYVQALNSFIEKFPAQETIIKNTLGEKDYRSLIRNLTAVKDLLVQINADNMADNCQKQIDELTTEANHEKIETFVTQFLSTLTMLSIDIQMAVFKDETGLVKVNHTKTTDKPGTGEISILAVDDSPFILGILRNILQDAGYKLTCVTSGADALKFILNHRPDLFILDIEMPIINGYELTKLIRENGHTAPVIFLTGNGTKEYVIQAVKAGAVDFIAKPIDKDHVLKRIAKYI